MLNSFIRRNVKVAEASSYGKSIFDYAPKSNGSRDYLNLAKEIVGREE
jgi:chromosome partitioning protein